MAGDGVEVLGVFVQSLATACLNLRVIAGGEVEAACRVDPMTWYPARRFEELFGRVVSRFPQSDPMRERIGMEMMKLWYDPGPGRGIVKTAADFLHYQTGSEGYHSIVRGPEPAKGRFALERYDEETGRAVVRSSTPFDRTMERGVLLGGLRLTGDAAFVSVDNSLDPSVFHVEFH